MVTGSPTGKQPGISYSQVRRLLWKADNLRVYGTSWTAQTNLVLEKLLFMIAKNPQAVFPSAKWLAEKLRISLRSVKNHTNLLVKTGILTKHERFAIWENTQTGQAIRIRTSNQYTLGQKILGWLLELKTGPLVQKSACNTDYISINKIRTGLTRQAEACAAWISKRHLLELDWVSDRRQNLLPLEP
jgi:hypothetical protein